MNGYITVQEAAEKWGVTPRQVQILCKENRIAGATRMSRIWVIPEDAEKPTDNRRSTNRRKNDASMHHV
ncbi:MAG: DNA-binding protein [Firmicutes bacterium]|nr:DNA-binding protein [Bacillota bacterium]